jgi:tetratricopeptide (TPR) repeat protein
MTRKSLSCTLLALMAFTLLAGPAWAWGPRARQAAAGMGMQITKQGYPTAFRPGKSNFEKDALQGALDGYASLEGTTLNSDAEVIQAINQQIQLLRGVRQYGPTSYFAYRMGVLGALVADLMMPFGFPEGAADAALSKQIEKDIDANLEKYDYSPSQRERTYMRNPAEYFHDRRVFTAADQTLIADDYARGTGYKGFLAQGGEAYFSRAVDAIADAWHTVLRVEPDASIPPASQPMLAAYFVKEIGYLLNEKRNVYQATEVYKSLDKVAQQMAQPYEQVGDLFYEFGSDETKERGVREWQVAHSLGGPERRRVASKLSRHYLSVGEELFEAGGRKGASETTLPSALRAFEQALDFDRTNDEAADQIQKTHVAIEERKQRLELVLGIIAEGEKLMSQADAMRVDGDLANAMRTYRQAIGFFTAVDDEFTDQEKVAKDKIRDCQNSISEVIRSIMDRASDAIEDGDQKREGHQYEQAIQAYTLVPDILAAINDEENPTFATEKREVAALAEKRIEEAKVAKLRYEQAQAEQAAAQKGGRPAAAPGAPGAPAAPVRPTAPAQ